jgi:toluene monooxygenase system protein D
MSKPVGPVLRMSDDVEGIVAAIVDDNPGQEVTVVDRGAYTRVSGDGELRVTRESIERHLGRAFAMRQLEGLMSAFAGRIEMTSDEVRWRLRSENPAPPGRAGEPA